MKSFDLTLGSAPAFKVAVAIVVGVFLGRLCPEGPNAIVVCSGLLGAIVLMLAFIRRRVPASSTTMAFGIAACLLMGTVKYLDDREKLPESGSVKRQRGILLGVVVTDPEGSGSRRNFVVRSEWFKRDSLDVPFCTDVIVTLARQRADSLEPDLQYGASVALLGLLDRPPEERNPGEMSMRDYYEALGITHGMEVRGGRDVRIVDREGGAWWMRRVIYPARRWMLMTFDKTTGGEEGEFLKGLILGERGGMSTLTKTAFVNAGVAHVLAVSGSNVAVVAGVLFLVLELLRVPRTVRLLPMLGGLLFYMLVTGSQPPVVRATIMAAVILVGKSLQRPVNAWNCIGLSAIIIAGIDARQIFDIGFQLSYGAVLSLMAIYPVMNEWIAFIPQSGRIQQGLVWLLRVCAVSLAATLGTLPLTAVCFGRVSVIGVLANIVVIPATELSVLLGAATVGAALVSEWMALAYGAVNWLLLHWTLAITRLAGFSPVAYITTVGFGPFDAVPYYVVLAALFLRSGRRLQHTAIALLFATAFIVLLRPKFAPAQPLPTLRVSVIDVGQGNAILAELPDRTTLLIDAGPRGATFDAGEKTVVPFLKRRGIASLDLLVVSHLHADHIGGLPSVVDGVNVGRILVLSPSALRATLGRLWPQCSTKCDSCLPASVLLSSSPARLYVLYPLPGVAPGALGGNESIVLKLVYGSVAFLFTGDAETTEEGLMIGRYGKFLESQVMKAGHHGSRTSSSERFLDAVQPGTVTISVGLHNKFRHPSGAVIARFNGRGIPVLRTDEEGALILETDGHSFWNTSWR